MSQHRKTVSVHILDKDYQVICEPDTEAMLTASARHLDSTMRGIRNTGKVVGSDRIAVMAALNVTNEMLHGQHEAADETRAANMQLKRLCSKLDTALIKFKQD
jgi:cell division protein ZapA